MSNRRRVSGFVGTGTKVNIAQTHRSMSAEALNKHNADAENTKTHLWLAIAAFQIPESQLQDIKTAEPHLDSENLLSITISCYVCEVGLRQSLVGTVCPGLRR